MGDNREELDEVVAVIEENITPQDLLKLAKWVLGVISLMFLFGCACEFLQKDSAIFEACKTILPPIATLVIGFYFGRSS